MEKDNPFKADLTNVPKDKIYYALAMFPYPSGAGLHVGHAMNFTANDIVARYKRMNGYTVINPMGWDSFGLPTEGYAMKVGKPASVVTDENVKSFIEQCKTMDWSFDRDREFKTSDPSYYKWTQWIFVQLHKAGLVYRKEAFVNWCPFDQTVLANDQLVDGKCERCGTEVIQKKHTQWFIKITDYAERLITDLDGLDWPEETKNQQKYWIGKSVGAEIDFKIPSTNDINETIIVGTERADEEKRHTISAVVQRKSDGKFLLVKWMKHDRISPSIGGIDDGETAEQAAEREVLEETGYKVKAVKKLGSIIESHFFAENKNIWRGRFDQPILLELIDENPVAVEDSEKETQVPIWLSYDELMQQVTHKDNLIGFERYNNENKKITVFTTRPDTIYGVTAIVLAPENESLDSLLSLEQKNALIEYRKSTGKKTALERQQTSEDKSGIFSGIYAIHPLTNEQVPVWYADYVLPDYATGAVMFVPAHDERDWAFAKKHGLEFKAVIASLNESLNSITGITQGEFENNIVHRGSLTENWKNYYYPLDACNTGAGVLINSGEFNGMKNTDAKKAIIDHLEKNGLGKRKITFKLRDWSISRQRYWGCPIPFYYTFDDNKKVPFFMYTEGNKAFRPGLSVTPRQVIQCVVKDKNSDEYCFVKWAHDGDVSTFFGGIEGDEDMIEGATRELQEEGGFKDITFVKELGEYHVQFYHPTKNRNQYSINHCLYFEVDRSTQGEPTDAEAKTLHEPVWMSAEEFMKTTKNDTSIFAMNWLLTGNPGIEKTTDKYNAYQPHPDKTKWIPHVIPEDELPVVLPLDLGNYKPAGKSPLADHPTFPYYSPSNKKVPFFKYDDKVWGVKEGVETKKRTVVQALIKDKNSDKFLMLKRKVDGTLGFVVGGVEAGEDHKEALTREIQEETGFKNIHILHQIGGEVHRNFFHVLKGHNQYVDAYAYYVEVDRADQGSIDAYELEKHEPVWLTKEEILEAQTDIDIPYQFELLEGKSGTVPAWIDRFNEFNPQPTYLRECDTLDTFIDSSFYFIRYADPKNDQQIISKELADKTLPVDFYMGGKEHTYGHLIYSRFIYKFLFDQGYLPSAEPFMKLVHQGFVLGPDGRKMSKRWGNVINPSEVANEYGSDTIRTYTMFMGPVESEKVWNPSSLSGVKKFIERVERLEQFIVENSTLVESTLHKTIKGVSEDIERLRFNTAVSKLMVFVNDVYDKKEITKQQLSSFLKLLAPFATKLTETMWQKLGHEGSIHFAAWPQFDVAKIASDSIQLPIQMNGKMKGTIEVNAGVTEDEIMAMIHADERLESQITGKEIVKVIYVQDKIINLIIK